MDQGIQKRSIVDFWRAFENLALQPAPVPNKDNDVKDVVTDADWPWLSPAYAPRRDIDAKGAPFWMAWFHVVYLGLCDMEDVTRSVFRIFQEPIDEYGRSTATGQAACAALVLRWDGLPLGLLSDSYALLEVRPAANAETSTDTAAPMPLELGGLVFASFPWALGRLQEMARDERDSMGSFSESATELRAALESHFSGRRDESGEALSFDLSACRDILDVMWKQYGWKPGKSGPVARVWSVHRKLRHKKRTTPVEADIMNSFLGPDLDAVIADIEAGTIGRALDDYLGAKLEHAVLPKRFDIWDKPEISAELAAPSRCIPGAWPAKGDHPLVFAQQVAVNAMWERLAGSTGLFSVNGPPGTGKTTMLRDVVASVVVARARALAEFKHPEDAFGKEVTLGEHSKVYPLDASIKGWEMVVASANNGAVQNVTLELPVLKQIDPDWWQEGLRLPRDRVDYFSTVATELLKPPAKEETEEESPEELPLLPPTAPQEAWALMGAVLGNSANRAHFRKSFWFGSFAAPGKKAPEVHTFQKEVKALADKGGATVNWAKAKKEFQAAESAFIRHRDEMAVLAELAAKVDQARAAMASLRQRALQANAHVSALTAQLAATMSACQKAGIRIEAAVAAERAAFLAQEKVETALRKSEAEQQHKDGAIRLAAALGQLRVARDAFEEAEVGLADIKDRQTMLPPVMHWLQSLIFRAEFRRREEQRKGVIDELKAAQALCAKARSALKAAQGTTDAVKTENDTLAAAIAQEQERALKSSQALAALLPSLENGAQARLVEAEATGNVAALHAEWVSWRDECRAREGALAVERGQLESDVRKAEQLAATATADVVQAEAIIASADTDERLIDLRRRGLVADSQFLKLDTASRERASPWMDAALRDARVRLFLAALQLHKAFIVAAWKPMRTNLSTMMDVLKGTAPDEADPYFRDLWGSLFLSVPVVSTTFASVGRLFRGMGRESIGWLFVDEAGQATPQQAVGALWRSSRALIIGDPLQVEPVVTTPAKMISLLRRKFDVPVGYAPDQTSVQRLADEANPIGAFMQSGLWIGCPLTVHRRCAATMFNIANSIAYDNRMIHGWTGDGSFVPLFGDSCWIDVRGSATKQHWIPEEGELARRMLDAALPLRGLGEKIFVISPFCSVKEGFHGLMGHAADWRKFNLGTVHTFQGQEADTVILLLGSGTEGARNWASAKPNLLNVAVTRAKTRLYVIGNHADWSGKPHFDCAADVLGDPLSVDELEARLAAGGDGVRVKSLGTTLVARPQRAFVGTWKLPPNTARKFGDKSDQ